jgi:hypothetical protein
MEQLLSNPQFAGLLAGIVASRSEPVVTHPMDQTHKQVEEDPPEDEESYEEESSDGSREEGGGDLAGPSNPVGQAQPAHLSQTQLVQANAVRLLTAQGVPVERAAAAVEACEAEADPTE